MSDQAVRTLGNNVARLSVSMLECLQMSSEEEVALGQWSRTMASVIDNWIGTLSESSRMTRQGADRYLEMLRREFGDNDLIDQLAEQAAQASQVFSCEITDKTMDLDWSRLRFKFMLNNAEIADTSRCTFLDKDELKVQAWKTKRKAKPDALVGVATVCLDSETSGTHNYPLYDPDQGRSKYPVGWLKVKLAISNRGRTFADVLSELLAETLKNALVEFGPTSASMSEEELNASGICGNPTYTIDILKSNLRVKSNVGYKAKIINQENVILPLQDISDDFISLNVEMRPKMSKSQKTSSVVIWTPTKNEKKRNSMMSSLDVSVLESPNIDGNVLLVDDPSTVIQMTTVPWKNDGLRVIQGDQEWTVQLKGKFSNCEYDFNLYQHLKSLYKFQILEAQQDQTLLTWDGQLSPSKRKLDAIVRPFVTKEAMETTKAQVLLELFHWKKFNCGVICQAIQDISDYDVYEVLKGFWLDKYFEFALENLFGIDSSENIDIFFYQTQLPPIAASLCLIIKNQEAFNAVIAVSSIKQKLELKFKLRTNGELLHYLTKHAFVAVGVLAKCNKSYAKTVASLILTEAISAAPGFGKRDLSKTFSIYMTLLDLFSTADITPSPEFYKAFEPYLTQWADLAILEATKQVDRVLSFESERHGQSGQHWDSVSSGNSGWLEGAICVKGIFDTCHNTWRDVKWPNPTNNIKFGVHLFKGMREVFRKYVQDFMSIVNSDNVFDKHEFVLILFSVLISGKYLENFYNFLRYLIENLSERSSQDELTDYLKEFYDSISQAALEADDTAEQVVMIFAENQRSAMKKYIIENRNDLSLLEYMDGLMYFLHQHFEKLKMDFSVKLSEVAKFKEMVTKKLFDVFEEELLREFNRCSELMTRSGTGPEAFEFVSTILPNAIEFRKHLGLKKSGILEKIADDLYPRSCSTQALITKQIMMTFVDNSENIVGKLFARIGFIEEESRLLVELDSVRHIVPRKKGAEVNFSITVCVLPFLKDPYIIRQKTPCFENRTTMIFSDYLINDHLFEFNLPSNAFDPRETVVEFDLYDQIPYKFQKVFRGAVVVELDEVQLITKEQDLKFVPLTEKAFVRPNHVDSQEFNILESRKDGLARLFLDRYNRQRQEKPFFESQEWAKADDICKSKNFICQYAEHLAQFQQNGHHTDHGIITLKVAFHEVLEELIIDILKVENMPPRPKAEDVNLGLAIRVLPCTNEDMMTPVYPNVGMKEVDFSACGKFHINLRKLNYNYHKTYVQVIAFDYERKRASSAKLERFFRGYIIHNLTDIHPIDTTEKFVNISPKKVFLSPLDPHENNAFKALLARKDSVAKEFLYEYSRFLDGFPTKLSSDLVSWKEPQKKPIPELISDVLEGIRLIQYSRSVFNNNGTLRYSLNFDRSSGELHIELKNITGVQPLNGDINCNFSLMFVVLPIDFPPYNMLKDRTSVFLNSTSLLFDLLEDEERTLESRSKFKINIPNAKGLNLEKTYVMIELYLHRTSRKYFRGSFLVPLSHIENFSQGEVMTSYFSKLPKEEDSSALNELEERRGESQAVKHFLERFHRNKTGQHVYTFFNSH